MKWEKNLVFKSNEMFNLIKLVILYYLYLFLVVKTIKKKLETNKLLYKTNKLKQTMQKWIVMYVRKNNKNKKKQTNKNV